MRNAKLTVTSLSGIMEDAMETHNFKGEHKITPRLNKIAAHLNEECKWLLLQV